MTKRASPRNRSGRPATEGVPRAMANTPSNPRRPTVRVDRDSDLYWYFGDRRRGGNGAGQIIAHVSDLTLCLATDLQRAMRRSIHYHDFGDSVLISEVDESLFDERDNLVSPVSFELHENALALDVGFFLDDYDEELQPNLVTQVLTPMLRRRRARLLAAWPDEYYAASPWLWHTRIGFHTRRRTLADLFEIGQDVLALMDAMASGQLTRATAADLVRGGHARVLVGQPEGQWLEVKSQHYDLATDGGQISLAQAVTRFCNAEVGGLVVVGMSAKRVPGGEEIRGLAPLPRDDRMIRRYQQIIEKRVFPPPDNLTIEAVDVAGEMLVLIDVPPQPEELKPFLVHGAIIDGRTEGAFISIVRRRGESSIPITAPMIHSMLAAGRALLRRGELPANAENHRDAGP